MEKYYYLTADKRQMGPIAPEEFKTYGITPNTYVWREGMPDWVPVSQLPSLMSYLYSAPTQTLTTPPPSYLVWAILSTLFCCIPTGIYAIIRACKVDSLWRQGDYEGAQKASKDAKLWTIIGAVIGFVCSIVYALYIASIVAASI